MPPTPEPQRPRAREAGIPFGNLPTGEWNAITDVPGVRVGHATLISAPGDPMARTGVTVILPHEGHLFRERVPAAVHTINGFGKAAGFEQVRELGLLETPIALTNTLSVGRVWDGLVTWLLAQTPEIGRDGPSVNPLVGECNDGLLNDLRARHVGEAQVLAALQAACSGPVEEGAVGAGTGMVCFGFKGGVGTASRQVGSHTVGALVITNFGARGQLTIAGAPVGQALLHWPQQGPAMDGSVMIVLATDAPLSDRQLGRLARRAGFGLARTGSTAGSGSGDFVIAFSTAQRIPLHSPQRTFSLTCLAEEYINPYFQAVVECVEEAVINSLFRAVTTRGRDGAVIHALPLEETLAVLHRPRL